MKKGEINVLIVDDDPTVARTMSEIVNRAGYKAVIAARGDEALNVVRMRAIHVALIDCMLPAMNGITLVEELRKTRFENGAVVLMSGIFRDKSFEVDAIRKTSAAAFLQKPFGPTDLLAALKPVFDSLVEEKQWSLQTILVRKMESNRDRVKLIEHLEQIRGVEAAFVLAILMEAKLSGHMNLVVDGGGIYGIKLQLGRVAAVDSENADELVIRFLIDTGYLARQDWEEFSARESKKFPLQKLVATGFVSPHAALRAQSDQVVNDVRRILKAEKVNLSFVPDQSSELSAEGLDAAELFLELNQTIDRLLESKFLHSFFHENINSPIRFLESFNFDHPAWRLPLVSVAKPHLLDLKEKTLSSVLQLAPGHADDILKAVYMLVMFRQILFLDPEKMKGFESDAHRREIVYQAINGKGPIEVFAYFGASAKATPSEIGNIFKEFARSNHPDTLPADASKDLREITNAVFGIVSGAHDVLTNPVKREAFQAKVHAEHAEKQMRADGLASEGAELIRRGSYRKAEERLDLSMQLNPNDETYALFIWSQLKQAGRIAKNDLGRVQKQLEDMLTKNRSSARIHMALGLVRAANDNPQQAAASFEKALSINPAFVEARREINALQGQHVKEETTSVSDILNGDITAIVSQLFKNKKAK